MSCTTCGGSNCGCEGITLPTATDGVSVTGVSLNGSNQLVFTLSSGTTITTNAINVTGAGNYTLLHNDTTSETTNVSGGPTLIGTKTYSVPLGTVTTDGSEIRATAWIKKTVTNPDVDDTFGFYVNNVWFASTPELTNILNYGGSTMYFKLTMTITRKSNTTVFIDYNCYAYNEKWKLLYMLSNGTYDDNATVGTVNFTTTALKIDVKGDADGTDTDLTCEKFTVEHFKK